MTTLNQWAKNKNRSQSVNLRQSEFGIYMFTRSIIHAHVE